MVNNIYNNGKAFKWSTDLDVVILQSIWLHGRVPGPVPNENDLTGISDFYNERIRFADSTSLRNTGEPNISTAQTILHIDAEDYVTNGPGRFASAAHAIYTQFFFRNLTARGDNFFDAAINFANNNGVSADENGYFEFTTKEFREIFFTNHVDRLAGDSDKTGLPNNYDDELHFSVFQYAIPQESGETNTEYFTRAFGAGSEGYKLKGAVFKVKDDGSDRYIEGGTIIPDRGQDYDYENSNTPLDSVGALGRQLDPEGISDAIQFRFTAGGRKIDTKDDRYDADDYAIDTSPTVSAQKGIFVGTGDTFSDWVDERGSDGGLLGLFDRFTDSWVHDFQSEFLRTGYLDLDKFSHGMDWYSQIFTMVQMVMII